MATNRLIYNYTLVSTIGGGATGAGIGYVMGGGVGLACHVVAMFIMNPSIPEILPKIGEFIGMGVCSWYGVHYGAKIGQELAEFKVQQYKQAEMIIEQNQKIIDTLKVEKSSRV